MGDLDEAIEELVGDELEAVIEIELLWWFMPVDWGRAIELTGWLAFAWSTKTGPPTAPAKPQPVIKWAL